MVRRMIPVRNIETGQQTQVGEAAFGYFAAHFERLDQPAPDAPVEAPKTVTPDKSAPKRPATTTGKE